MILAKLDCKFACNALILAILPWIQSWEYLLYNDTKNIQIGSIDAKLHKNLYYISNFCLYHQYSCTYACGSYFTEEKKQQRRNFQKFLINSASNLFCNISSSNIICLMKHKSNSKDKSVPATFTWNQRLFASSTIYNMSCFADLENYHQILWEICQNCVGIAAIFFWKLQITACNDEDNVDNINILVDWNYCPMASLSLRGIRMSYSIWMYQRVNKLKQNRLWWLLFLLW